jgi:hypothetical protein
MRHPEASHANYYASRFSFSEAEGSAPLHHRAITNCLDGVALKSSGADPSPSRLEHGYGEGMACSAQGGTFNRTMIREQDTASQETH